MLKICIIEACRDQDVGSIGPFYIAESLQSIGYQVDVLRNTKSGYDIELISVHHCTDFPLLAMMKKRAKVRIIGGHPMQNNPRPVIPLGDIICIGEGETWIKNAVKILDENNLDIDSMSSFHGTIISKNWINGSKIPETNIEKPLPDNPPYLNRPGTRSAAWYLEIARGCPYKCYYCELGHSTQYRRYSYDHLIKKIDQMDTSITRKINFYAPDEASHPDFSKLFDHLKKKGFLAGFSSMRVDTVMKNKPPLRMNTLIRVGIDGLSEETRKRVNKKITDDQIVEYFKYFIDKGNVQFKMFMIFGYPWEKLEDFQKFEILMQRIFNIKLHKNISLRVKWTPLIPQPCTPLGNEKAKFDFEMVDKINIWHALHKRPRQEPGIFIENDGLMGIRSHKMQCNLTSADENYFNKQ